MSNRERLIAVLVAAATLRLVVLLAFPGIFAYEVTGAVHGSAAYDTYAVNLLETGVYGKSAAGSADAHLPPLYSYLLAVIYGVLGRGHLAVGLVHIALDLVAITALYAICTRLFAYGEAIGLLASVFYSAYPYLIFQNLTLIDTPLFMCLLYCWLWTIVLLREPLRAAPMVWILAVTSGVLLGLLALTRTNAVLLAPLAALWLLLRLHFRQAAARVLIIALVSALVVMPWLVRSYRVYGVFVPIALNGGENFYQGNNAYTLPYFRAGYDVQWVPGPSGLGMGEMTPERSSTLAAAGWTYLLNNPAAIPELLWTKFLVHWSIDIAPARNPVAGEEPRIDYQGDTFAERNEQGDLIIGGLPPGDPVDAYSGGLFNQIGRPVHQLYYGVLFLLALAGCAVTRSQWRTVSLLWLVQFGATFSYVLFHPSTRYRVPTDPLLFALSAAALVAAYHWLRVQPIVQSMRAPRPEVA
jgi:hypothetical protein